MPRFANVSNRDYEERAQAGARASEEFDQRAFARQNQQRIAAYEQMHLELERAKQERQLAHDQAQTERRLKYEYRMADAIPKLYAIDPRDPTAQAQRAQFAKDYPDLFHKETGIPNITQEFEQHQRLSESAQRQRDAVDARKEAADARREGSSDLQTQRQDFAKEMLQMKAEQKAQAGPSEATRKAHGLAAAKAAELQTRIDANQKFIDEQSTKPEEDTNRQHDLPRLQKSHDELLQQFNEQRIRKEVMEGIHPELATPPAAPGAAAAPALATEGDRPPPEPEPTGDEAAPAAATPANPNLTPPPAVVPPAVAVPAPVVPPVAPDPHKAALDWAAANPGDPRAAKIKALHGVQ